MQIETQIEMTSREGLLRSTARRLLRALVGTGGRASINACERLEQRTLLATSPLPDISDLENPNHPVIRFETNFGDIDIELFTTNAPITVRNFLNYVNTGRLDETFFHRLSKKTDPGGLGGLDVLQGGGFAYDNRAGLSTVSTDAPIILEQTGRSNVGGTLSMARTSNPNSATSQFFINVTDNTTLDPSGPNSGFAVFGRIIQGLDVVQTIYNLDRPDLSFDPAFAGPFETNFEFAPVTSAYSEVSGVRENALVSIVNAEMIKVENYAGFLDQELVMPEGFHSETTTEIVELTNANPFPMRYQILARYEVGGNDVNFNPGARDQLVASGVIEASSSLRVTLTSTETTFNSVISPDSAYSVVVQSGALETDGAGVPLAATFQRSDFGATTSEAFFNPSAYSSSDMQTWTFARVERGEASLEYLLLYNTTNQFATATITIYTGGTTRTITRGMDAYKRSGVSFAEAELPEGPFSIRITSTQPIVAFVSDWDTPRDDTPASDAYTPGWMISGTPGGGATAGALAQADVRPDHSNLISLLNTGTSTTTVTLNVWRLSRATGEQPLSSSQILLGRGRLDVDLADITTGLSAGEPVSITYTAPAAITAQWTSVDESSRGLVNASVSDGISTAFVTRQASQVLFAEGLFDPTRINATQNEVLSIFNPSGEDGASLAYTATYLFSDGTGIDVTGTLPAAQRFDIRTSTLNQVLAKINSGTQFRTYGIRVTGVLTVGSVTTGMAGVVSLVRRDSTLGEAAMSTGFQIGPITSLIETQISGGSGSGT